MSYNIDKFDHPYDNQVYFSVTVKLEHNTPKEVYYELLKDSINMIDYDTYPETVEFLKNKLLELAKEGE